MLEVQRSYQAMLRVLRGESDFVPIVIKNFDELALSKQIECIVTAIGEHAAKNKESAPSASSNSQSDEIIADIKEVVQSWFKCNDDLTHRECDILNSVVKCYKAR